MSRVPTALIAALTLVVGFAVAQATGVRALGGVVLLAGVAWCAWRSRAAGAARVVAVVVIGAVCFVAAHVVGHFLNAWVSVVLVAAVLGVWTWYLVDRPVRAVPLPA